ncbi:AbrB/MazE/SpoVT family DNA-binding domain-containing protein [Halovivax limisalsi]|uniref:AbrB/MazE/SpoVT family DNA-binding domain-containing protein n=1 Tax=Halovivax limisalsi TaxID=1453760 RepID=UPI001FFC4A70|nr:AbrB/MazE/SpoVT family DNA-binding domain-containing protein [Halovivax limisalsi]
MRFEAERRIDENGRVTLPESVRDQLDLEAGDRVRITVEDDRVVLRPCSSRIEFAESMAGVIDDETRREGAPSLTPADLKADWTSDWP